MEETENEGTEPDQTGSGSRDRLEKFGKWHRCMVELGPGSHEPGHQEPPFRQIRVVFSPLYGDLLMKRPLRNRTVGAVRGGRGNLTLYSINLATDNIRQRDSFSEKRLFQGFICSCQEFALIFFYGADRSRPSSVSQWRFLLKVYSEERIGDWRKKPTVPKWLTSHLI